MAGSRYRSSPVAGLERWRWWIASHAGSCTWEAPTPSQGLRRVRIVLWRKRLRSAWPGSKTGLPWLRDSPLLLSFPSFVGSLPVLPLPRLVSSTAADEILDLTLCLVSLMVKTETFDTLCDQVSSWKFSCSVNMVVYRIGLCANLYDLKTSRRSWNHHIWPILLYQYTVRITYDMLSLFLRSFSFISLILSRGLGVLISCMSCQKNLIRGTLFLSYIRCNRIVKWRKENDLAYSTKLLLSS